MQLENTAKIDRISRRSLNKFYEIRVYKPSSRIMRSSLNIKSKILNLNIQPSSDRYRPTSIADGTDLVGEFSTPAFPAPSAPTTANPTKYYDSAKQDTQRHPNT